MSILFDLENIHRKNMEDLYYYFQSQEVETLYTTKRKELEEKSKTKEFVPTLAFKAVYDIIKEIHNK